MAAPQLSILTKLTEFFSTAPIKASARRLLLDLGAQGVIFDPQPAQAKSSKVSRGVNKRWLSTVSTRVFNRKHGGTFRRGDCESSRMLPGRYQKMINTP